MSIKKFLLKLSLLLCFSIQIPVKTQTPVEYLKANGIVGAQKYLEVLAGALIGRENAPYFTAQLEIVPAKLKFFMIKQDLKSNQVQRDNLKKLLETNFSNAALKEISRAKDFNLVMTNNLVKSLKELNDLINGNLREYILDLNEPKTEAEFQALLIKIKSEFQTKSANDDAKLDLIAKIMEIADIKFVGPNDPEAKAEHPAESVVKVGDQIMPNYFFKAREKFSIALGGMGYEYGMEKKYIGKEIFETIDAIKATIKSLAPAPSAGTQTTKTPEEIALEALGTEASFETFIINAKTLFSTIQKKVSQGEPQDNLNKFLNKLAYISLARKESLSEAEKAIYQKIETDNLSLIKPIKDLKTAGLTPLTNAEVQQFITLRDFIIEKLNALVDLELLTITADSDLAKIFSYLEGIKLEEPKSSSTLTPAQLLEKAIDTLISPAKNADGSTMPISTYLNNDYNDSGIPNLTLITAFYDDLAKAALLQKDAPASDMKINPVLATNMTKRSELKKALDDAFSGRGVPALKHQYPSQDDKNAIQLVDLNSKFTGIRKILAGTLPEIAQILNSNKNKIKPDPEILETQINTILSIDIDPTNTAEENARNMIKAAIDDAKMYEYAKPTTNLTKALEKLFPPIIGTPTMPKPEPLTQMPQKSALELAIDEIISPSKNDDGTPMSIAKYLNTNYVSKKAPDLKLIKDFYDKLSITVLSKYDSPINSMVINEALAKDKVQRERLKKALDDALVGVAGRGIPALKHQFIQNDEDSATLADLNAKFTAIRKILSGSLSEIASILTANKSDDPTNPAIPEILEEQINKILKAEKITDLQLDPGSPAEEGYKNEIKAAIDDAKLYNYAKSTTNLVGAMDKLFPPATVVVLPATPPPAPETTLTPSITKESTPPVVQEKPVEITKTLEEMVIIAAEAADNFETLKKVSSAKNADKKASAADKATAKQAAVDANELKKSAFKALVAKTKATSKEDVKTLRNQFILEKKEKEKKLLIEAFNTK